MMTRPSVPTAPDTMDSDLAQFRKIQDATGGNAKNITAFFAAQQKFAQDRAAAKAKADAEVARAAPRPIGPEGPPPDPDPVDGDLDEYKRLRAELGGNDDTVAQYLAARQKMAEAKAAAALVSPELARAQALMKEMGPLDLDVAVCFCLAV
jgi:hypothetical protein